MANPIQTVTVQVPQRVQTAVVQVPARVQVVAVQTGVRGLKGKDGIKGDKGDKGDPASAAVAGTGWAHVTNGAWDAEASTPTPDQVGADVAGAAASVQGNLESHAGATGTSVHGLGSAATHAASDFDASGAAATAAAGKADKQNITRGTYTKVTVGTQGTVESGDFATKSDLGLGNVPNTDFTDDILRTKWGLSTGVIDGCVLSIDPNDNTKIKNTAGHCLYVDCSDPANPVVDALTVPEASTAPVVGADGIATLFIVWAGFARVSSGVGAITFSTEFSESDRRRITVGGRLWATGIGQSSIATVTNYTAPAWGADKTMEDLAYALGGSINIDGNDFSAHAGQLTLDKSAGHSFRLYGNSGTNRDVPNNPVNGPIAPLVSYRYWAASGTTYGNELHATIDPDYYDNGGTRTALSTGKWTIQRVYYFPGSSTVAVSYGQAYFDTLDAAKAAANTQAIAFSDMASRMFHGGLLRARVYVQQGATDLSGAYVERMTAFVGGGAGSGGGTIVDHATLAHLDYLGAGHTGFVPATRKVNGTDLSADMTIFPSAIPQDATYKFVNDLQIASWGSAFGSAHSHSNKATLDSIAGAVVVSAGTTQATSGTVAFSNSNGLAFGMNGNTITGSYTVPTQTAFVFSNGGGVSFGTNASTVTASVQTNYLTTAMASNQSTNFAGLGTTLASTAGTDVKLTVNTAGINLAYPKALTTAMASDGGTKFLNVGTTGGTNASVTLASNGLSISVGNYITTAMASNAGSAFAGTGFSLTTTAGTAVVGTHGTNGLSLGVPAFLTTAQAPGAYLTTAMVSNAGSNFVAASGAFSGTNISGTIGSNGISLSAAAPSGGGAGTGFTTAATAGATVVGTLSTNGLSLGMPAFITTAMASGGGSNFIAASAGFTGANISGTLASNGIQLSVAAPGAGGGFAAQGSGTYTQNTGTIQFAASNGITFGLTNNQMTASHNALTTAMASNAGSGFVAASAAFSGTNASGTIASNGISISVAAPGAGGGAALQGSGTYTQNTGTVQFSNLNGVSFGLTAGTMTASHNGLTTAMASNAGTAFAGTGFSSTTTAGAAIVGTHGSNGLSLGVPAFLTTAQAPGAYLTTAMASNASTIFAGLGFTDSTTTGTDLLGTLSTNGLSILIPAFLTTAMASNAGSNFVAASATIAGTNISGTIASNRISLSVAAPGGGAATTLSTWWPYFPASTSSQTMGAFGTSTASAMAFPFYVDDAMAFNCINLVVSMSFVSSTVSGQQSITHNFGIFSNNAGTLSLISSNSSSIAATVSSISATLSFPMTTNTTGYAYGTVQATGTAQAQSLFGTAGNRIVQMQFGNSMLLAPGMYWLGLHQRQSTSSAAVGVNTALVGNAMNGTSGVGPIGLSTAAYSASSAYHLGAHGVFTSTGLANHSGTNLPSTMALAGFNNNLNVMPLFTFAST